MDSEARVGSSCPRLMKVLNTPLKTAFGSCCTIGASARKVLTLGIGHES
jgi:hypothetical protein